jgi:hypothetical protein
MKHVLFTAIALLTFAIQGLAQANCVPYDSTLSKLSGGG